MIAVTSCVKERLWHVKKMAKVIMPYARDYLVVCDENRRGAYWNMMKSLKIALKHAGKDEPVFFSTDDIKMPNKWYDMWEDIHKEANDGIYTLMARRKYLFKDENLKRGFVSDHHKMGFYDHGMILVGHNDIIDKTEQWILDGGVVPGQNKGDKLGLDTLIWAYLRAHDMPWTITTPTLVDHCPLKSTVGHTIGASAMYIGDVMDGTVKLNDDQFPEYLRKYMPASKGKHK